LELRSEHEWIYATKDYVLGLAGEQLTELSMDANGSMAWLHTNVYANGKLFATYDTNGLHFHFTDQLGTPRAQADYTGVLEQACSSMPYGDALSCTGSIQAPTDLHFTGKERDAETGLDNFGARYYASGVGRWISPDWSAGPSTVPYASVGDPQSLNLYAYTRNNPLSMTDIDGHHMDCGGCSDPFGGTPDFGQRPYEAQREEARVATMQRMEAYAEAVQQQNASSGGGFWHHVSNLLRGHSRNYIKATVTADDGVLIGVHEPNSHVDLATRAVGLHARQHSRRSLKRFL
jgi:RHS repeat-associated protein